METMFGILMILGMGGPSIIIAALLLFGSTGGAFAEEAPDGPVEASYQPMRMLLERAAAPHADERVAA
jgi:hypothetical protein